MATIKKAKNGLKEPNNPGLKQLPTPVRNKMGFKKNGGAMKAKMGASIKKAANGTTTTKTTMPPSGMIQGMDKFRSPQRTEKPTPPKTPTTPSRTPMNSLPPEPPKRNYIRPADTSPERFPTSGVSSNVTAKRGKTIKKAQNGTVQSANQQTQSNVNKIAMKNAGDSIKKSMAGNAKNGKSMKKCRYGCK